MNIWLYIVIDIYDELSLCINCSMADCFPEKSRWCSTIRSATE